MENKPSPGPGEYETERSLSKGIKEHPGDIKKFRHSKRSSLDSIGSSSPRSNAPGPGDYEIYKSSLEKGGPFFKKV